MSERFKLVADHPGFVKDMATNAILNNDAGALQSYKLKKKQMRESAERLDKLEQDVSDIKEMLHKILGKL